MTLRDEFSVEINTAIDQCCELGYIPTRLKEMIETRHPVEVAKSFVISGDFQDGFERLNNMGKPELTVEGIMLQPKYISLFTASELKAAKWRLENVNNN